MPQNNRWIEKLFSQFGVLTLLIIVWELTLTSCRNRFVPKPSAVMTVLAELFASGSFLKELTAGLSRDLAGFALAAAIGTISRSGVGNVFQIASGCFIDAAKLLDLNVLQCFGKVICPA